jgi:hypothetical protein
MKYLITMVFVFCALLSYSQSVVGTWQLTEEKTCFQSQFEQTDTEKELAGGMGGTKNAIAKLISFDKKGAGEEGIFSQGRKKGASMNPFKYKVSGQELHFVDKKSGIITSRFIIDELSDNTLRFHNAMKDCETKSFTKVK